MDSIRKAVSPDVGASGLCSGWGRILLKTVLPSIRVFITTEGHGAFPRELEELS
jgi:hypothetical protein